MNAGSLTGNLNEFCDVLRTVYTKYMGLTMDEFNNTKLPCLLWTSVKDVLLYA